MHNNPAPITPELAAAFAMEKAEILDDDDLEDDYSNPCDTKASQ